MTEPQENPVDAAAPAEVAPAPAEARRARRRRAMGGVVALVRSRLKRAAGARVAWLLAVVVALVFAASALVVRGTDGGEAPLASVVGRAAQWLLWLASAPLALSIARRRPLEDRADGIEALAASRGFSTRSLESARVLSAITQSSLILGVPLVALAALVVGLAGSPRIALARAPLLAGAPLFAIVAGGTLGALAVACARVGGPRGRLVLCAVVLLPWMLSAELGHASWSIPGALDALRSFALPRAIATRVSGVGAIASLDAAWQVIA